MYDANAISREIGWQDRSISGICKFLRLLLLVPTRIETSLHRHFREMARGFSPEGTKTINLSNGKKISLPTDVLETCFREMKEGLEGMPAYGALSEDAKRSLFYQILPSCLEQVIERNHNTPPLPAVVIPLCA